MSNKVEATFHPGTAPAQIEARSLAGLDIGRIVTATDHSGKTITGELESFKQSRTQTQMRLLFHKVPVEVRTYPGELVTILGRIQ